MGRLLSTALLCLLSMIGSALIASQGFRPDPIAAEAPIVNHEACESIDNDADRRDCIDRESDRLSQRLPER